jgi:type II secretory pathway component GspD/PulD (secretin)
MVQLFITKLEVNDVARIDNIRGVDLPVFATRSQAGIVLVPNGQAMVIGGLSSRITRRTERRVPVLGRIPIVGIPFRGRRSEIQNIELLIFVSPTVVDLRKMSPNAQSALDFWRNGSWQNEDTIRTEIDLMQTER